MHSSHIKQLTPAAHAHTYERTQKNTCIIILMAYIASSSTYMTCTLSHTQTMQHPEKKGEEEASGRGSQVSAAPAEVMGGDEGGGGGRGGGRIIDPCSLLSLLLRSCCHHHLPLKENTTAAAQIFLLFLLLLIRF